MAFGRYIEITAGPEGKTGRTVTDNYMSFEIEKSIGKKWVNKATVKIYNLSENTANIMGAAKNKIIISTGYTDESIETIFFGDIHKSKLYKENTQKILEIEAYDGQKAINKSVFLSYTAKTDANVIMNAILSKLAYPVKNKPELTDVYMNGYVCSGNAYNALQKLLKKSGYKCMIQNAAIVIYSDDEKAPAQTGLYLSSDTGLLQADVVDEIKGFLVDAGELPTKSGSKLKIKSLIFPQLYPGALVTVVKGDTEAVYKIRSAKYVGDNFGGDYYAEMEATKR